MPTTPSTPSTGRCTTTSVAAATTSCSACGRSATRRSTPPKPVRDRAGGGRVSAEVTRQIRELRETVARLHTELTRYNLVAWTSGNVSARVLGQDLLVIKPSGVSYDDLTADTMVVCDLDGTLVEGTSPVQRHRGPRLRLPGHARGRRVVHTHSSYATAWAARGEAIPATSPPRPTSSAGRSRWARSP
ncbi:class II aldolase/adducin family protein [Micromonospora sp. M12]